MNIFLVAQFLGLLSMVCMMLSSWQLKRKNILFYLIFDNIFCFLQYILLGAYNGAFTNIIGLFRTMTFSKKGSDEFYKTNNILYIILTLYATVGILTYKNILGLFPTIASLFYAIVLWQEKPKYIRIGTSIMLFMWFLYNIFVAAYIGAVCEGVMLISSIFAIIKIDIIKNSKKENNFSNRKLNKIMKAKRFLESQGFKVDRLQVDTI
jgi:hypothetical protein